MSPDFLPPARCDFSHARKGKQRPNFKEKPVFPFLAWENRISQGVENRGSLILVCLWPSGKKGMDVVKTLSTSVSPPNGNVRYRVSLARALLRRLPGVSLVGGNGWLPDGLELSALESVRGEKSGPLNRLNAIISLLQPLDRYRAPSAIGSAIGRPYLALSRFHAQVKALNRLVLNRFRGSTARLWRYSVKNPFKTSAKQKRDRGRDSQPRPRPRLNSQPQGATKKRGEE